MPYDAGDAVLVPFPFTNQTALKRRPAIVVSTRQYNDLRPDVIVAAVTSQLHANAFGEALLVDWSHAGLLKPSVVKPLVATIEQSVVLRKLGQLSPADLANVILALRQIMI